jgi:hypothetical protein
MNSSIRLAASYHRSPGTAGSNRSPNHPYPSLYAIAKDDTEHRAGTVTCVDMNTLRQPAPAVLLIAFVLAGVGCSRNSAGEPPAAGATVAPAPHTGATVTLPDGPGLRVLFLGNSLTEGNDLPALVQAMAAAGGVTLHYHSYTMGGANLEDHWQRGTSRELLAAARWDFVVLQQGPSSLPESQADLRKWAGTWADAIRAAGATPALYMVWPFQNQADGFKLVSQSYRTAATAARARVFPAGEAWQESLRRDPAVALYQSDGLHPTEAGSYLAALVMTHGLTGVKPRAVPARLTLDSGRVVALPEETARKLRQAAETAIAQ